jgi:succinoglycan biosynthesis protein ExoA
MSEVALSAAPAQGSAPALLATVRPRVSVIIPIRNEREAMPGLLVSLAAQDCPDILEVLLVDGMSDDGTRAVIEEQCRADARLRLLDNPRRVVTTALNLGLAEATGDVIVRMDAHAEYAPDYVSKCLEVLAATGAGNVGGPQVPASDGSLIGDVILAVHESPFGIGAAKFRQAGAAGWVDSVWPGAYRREALQAAGMHYVEALTRSEDIEMNSRVRGAGWGIYLSSDIRARYYPRKSIGALCRQNYGNGFAVVQTLKAGLGGVSLRHLVPAAFVSVLGLSGGAAPFSRWGLWALGLVLGLYALADLACSLQAARKHGLRVLALLPLTFVLLHFSYGFGSLAAVFARVPVTDPALVPGGPGAPRD